MDHRVLGDALEGAGAERRGDEAAVARHEDVLAGALGDEPLVVEHERLVVAGLERLHLGEAGVHVVAGGLRRRRHRVVVVARPAADLHAHALGEGVVAEVGAPRPAGDRHVDGARQRVEPHLAVAVVGDRPDVAAGQAGGRDRVLGGLHDVVDRVRDLHAEDGGAAEQPLDVVGEPEDAGTVVGLVGADPLEHAHAVVERVGEDVDAGVVPVDELAVHPDLLGGGDGHGGSFLRCPLEAGGDLVADLGGGAGEAGDLGAGLAHTGGGVALAEVVEHEGRREDGGDGVGLVLPGDVGRRAVDRLEHGRTGAGGVQVGARGEPDPPGYRAAEVGEDVAEEVVGDDHVVLLGRLHEVDAGGVDVVVGGGDVGVLGGDLVEGALPEVAGEGHDVRLVHEGEVLARPALGQVEGVADAALHAHAGVHAALGGHLVGRALAERAALAGVGALGVLPDHDHVDVVLGVREGPQVDVEVELEAHAEQQAALDHAGRHAGGADGADQQGVEAPPLLDDLVGEDHAVAQVAGAAEVVVDGVEGHAGGAHHLERLRDDLGTDPVAAQHPDLVTQLCSLLPPLERKNRPPGWTVGRSAHGEPVRYTMMITAWWDVDIPGSVPLGPTRSQAGTVRGHAHTHDHRRAPRSGGPRLRRPHRHPRRARCTRRRARRRHVPARPGAGAGAGGRARRAGHRPRASGWRCCRRTRGGCSRRSSG